METHEVLMRPVVSEKSTELASDNKYTFEVSMRSNKIEIRRAVEDRYQGPCRVSSNHHRSFQGEVAPVSWRSISADEDRPARGRRPS